MLRTYTAKYTKISSGYMGQLVEWPDVITEGKDLEDCRELLQDAVQEMIAAYRQQDKEIPVDGSIRHLRSQVGEAHHEIQNRALLDRGRLQR